MTPHEALTPHEAMAAWAAACVEYRQAEDLRERAVAQIPAGIAPHEVQPPLIGALKEAIAVLNRAATAVPLARWHAWRAYEDSGPSGAGQLLLLLTDQSMFTTDVPAIEAAIAATFTPPVVTA